MLKIMKYGLLGLLALTVVSLPFSWPFIRMVWVFIPSIPAPDYEAPATVAEARLQDIDYLSTLLDYDRSFSEDAKSDFTSKLAVIENEVEQLSAAAFYLRISEAVALADNGHTSVSYRAQYAEFNTIGARMYAFEDGVYIVATAPDKAETLGHRVVAVNGIPIHELQEKLARFKGGSTTWRRLYSTLMIESPELLAAAGYGADSQWADLTIEDATGELREVRFEGLSLQGDVDIPWRSAWQTLVPGGATAGFSDWSHVLSDEDAQPRYLTDLWQPLSYPLDNNGFYIRALPGVSVGERSIKSTYKAILSEHAEASLDYLVIDFRNHDGGDYTKSMAFAEAAPNLVKDDGDIYIITGPNTFSAAIVTVAMLKYYSGDRGVIIGEQLGDREQFWAERGSSFQLPNSGYHINYATGYHDWENGCKGEPYCYTMNEMYEVPAGSLDPEVLLPQDFASYAQGKDVVMEWIAQRR